MAAGSGTSRARPSPGSGRSARPTSGAETPPAGPILAVRVADLGEKEAVLTAGHRGLFSIPHFDNYPAVLVDLPTVSAKVLRETLEDGWLCRANERLTTEFLAR